MSKKTLLLELSLMLCFMIIPACKAETSSDKGADQIEVPSSINLAVSTDLRQTTQIDLLARLDRNESTSAGLEMLFAITDEETIYSLVDSLDNDLELSPRASCPSYYTLVFHLADGGWHEFDYACEMASPSFLRGGQEFWHGSDITVPGSFKKLIREYIIDAAVREKAMIK